MAGQRGNSWRHTTASLCNCTTALFHAGFSIMCISSCLFGFCLFYCDRAVSYTQLGPALCRTCADKVQECLLWGEGSGEGGGTSPPPLLVLWSN